MFGLDDWIAGLSDGGSIAVVVAVAVLLGLRHATDPDHIAAVSTLVASGRERATAAAAHLGMWWGIGHAITLAAFGIGLVHGMGGSAGVGVLLLAAIPSREVAVAALLVLALFTAVSMTIVTTGL